MSAGLLIYIMSNLFTFYVIYRFTNIFFNKGRIDKRIETGLFLIIYLISTITNILFEVAMLNLIVNIIGIFIITTIYRESFIKRILFVILVYSVMMSVDSIIGLLVSKYVSLKMYYIIAGPVMNLAYLILELVIENLEYKNKNIPKKQGKILLIIPIISMISIWYMFYMNPIEIKLIVIQCSVLLLINMTAFNLYDWIIEAFSQEYEKSLLKQQLESYTNQVELMRQSQERVNSINHDIKHHILAIDNMAKENRSGDILKYINTMVKEMDNPHEYVKSGNISIDTIVNYMVSKVNKLTNNIEVEVKVPNDINLDRFNINIILGNLLQNSLRALEEVENGELKLLIEYDKCIMYIKIENSYSGHLKMNGDKYISTKKDSELHGIGLDNVKKIVEKYSGEMNICSKNNKFKVNIMVYV